MLLRLSAEIFLIVFVLALAAGVLTRYLCGLAISKHYLQDEVTERSSHKKATSRAGGVAMMASFVPASILALFLITDEGSTKALILIFLVLLATILGYIDDRRTLTVSGKFLGQIVLAALLVTALGGVGSLPLPVVGEVPLGAAGYFVGILWVVGFINVFNFMDGLNGMAGVTALVAGLAMLALSFFTDRMDILIITIMMCAALAGFLSYNFRQGNIFLGDAGSHGLGLLLAGLALLGSNVTHLGKTASAIDFLFLPIVFLPFIMDVTITLWRRIVERKRLYEAHKEHFYQKLHHDFGVSHTNVALIYAGLALFSVVVALLTTAVSGDMKWLGPVALACFLGAGLLLAENQKQNKSA
jgi:UDP-N-acetylmuramyl pentapeptide phosphotransferase/UDP-N-acetylglucosamine-1-phosphate transferase